MHNGLRSALAAPALLLGALSLAAQESDQVLLKDFKPQSIFRIPQHRIQKAKYPAIDVHYHAQGKAGPAERLKAMDEVGVEKAVIFAGVGPRFDAAYEMYSKHPGRFELWCGFDLPKPGEAGVAGAVTELERCVRVGAKGVGEIADKGKGLRGAGMHPDDPRMDPLWKKCAELRLPVNLHVADPRWVYEKMDNTNDGLMDAFKWRLDNQKDIVGFDGMIDILERTLKRHPKTVFVACHYANLDYDLSKLGELFDKYPNFYADISARTHYVATIPRAAAAFMEKYQDRLLYGTDAGFSPEMYRNGFRILETRDDHFYENRLLPSLHWPLYGLGLSDQALKKLYRDNALKILHPESPR
jgi:predicted TIM-barrel fold metal-dependent hydrolase